MRSGLVLQVLLLGSFPKGQIGYGRMWRTAHQLRWRLPCLFWLFAPRVDTYTQI